MRAWGGAEFVVKAAKAASPAAVLAGVSAVDRKACTCQLGPDIISKASSEVFDLGETYTAASNRRRVDDAILLQVAVAVEVADQALGRGRGTAKIISHDVDLSRVWQCC